MEEELNEHDLEERLYAMLHHVDETQNNLNESHPSKLDLIQLVENGPRSTVRRYWRTGPDITPYQKTNTAKEPIAPTVAITTHDPTSPAGNKITKDPTTPALTKTALLLDNSKTKEERSPPKPPSPVDLTIFQSPVPQNVKKTIEFLDHEEENAVVLETSDEDEVVEIALPPKPTITIESSDDDELDPKKQKSPHKHELKLNSSDRAVSASPVPSVVSSVSDEFIRGDCIALNISSKHPDKHSFDFSLHGSDLLVQTNASSKKKKRKKNKEAVTSTPIVTPPKPAEVVEACFATPKGKAKNKKQRSKQLFTEKSAPNLDIYDSDSNLSTADSTKNKNLYTVTEKSLPSVDVYESDSNHSEILKENNTDQSKDKYVMEAYSSDSSISNDKPQEKIAASSKKSLNQPDSSGTIDLTGNDTYVTLDDTGICDDSIVIGNVTGFTESMDYGDEDESRPKSDISKYVSSKMPSILNDNLDFDNLKGNEKVCKKRRYSLTTLRAEMEKFYNESWGGEDFNHKEIMKNMSRDKSLWAIDPKDRMQIAQRKTKCNYCNRVGHRDDMCRQKPAVCYMCGNTGHYEPRCPTKICVNCGAANFMYSNSCRNCSMWPQLTCAECGQRGHPASHCPDLWRRYHSTISTEKPLETCTQVKKSHQLFCSGCSRRGHLVHTCRLGHFSGLPVNSPYVQLYRPLFAPSSFTPKPHRNSDDSPRPDRNKRASKSPAHHDTHLNKKRNVSADDSQIYKQISSKPKEGEKNKSKLLNKSVDSIEKTDVPVSTNHDNKGRVIQDNEVSDTSDVVTSARIYVTNDIITKLKTQEGEEWLKATMGRFNVSVGPADVNSFLSITGKLADQEQFQTELREWTQQNSRTTNSPATEAENSQESNCGFMLPKNRNNMLRQLNKAMETLSKDLGDPRALYKELVYSQNQHEKMKRQKVISPQRLSNNRTHINDVLKKLNTILLGQAGLADGSEHLNHLISFKQKLLTSREKTIPTPLRKAMAEHYQCIFSSSARNDYTELVQKYYVGNAAAKLAKKKKKRKSSAAEPAAPSAPSEPRPEPGAPPPNQLVVFNPANLFRCRKELGFLNKRLQSIKKSGACPKNFKNEMLRLMRKVHITIGALFKDKNINSKQSKKAMRVQHEAQMFLSKM